MYFYSRIDNDGRDLFIVLRHDFFAPFAPAHVRVAVGGQASWFDLLRIVPFNKTALARNNPTRAVSVCHIVRFKQRVAPEV